jgi:GT2 family glycosyltransferase
MVWSELVEARKGLEAARDALLNAAMSAVERQEEIKRAERDLATTLAESNTVRLAMVEATDRATAAEQRVSSSQESIDSTQLADRHGAAGAAILTAAEKLRAEREVLRSRRWQMWTRLPHARKRFALTARRRLFFAPLRRSAAGRLLVLLASGLYTSQDGPGRRAIFAYCRGTGGTVHPLFDANWYMRGSPDVAQSGLLAALHYLRSGDAEGRDPHPLFDVRWYREQYAGHLKTWALTALEHFIMVGARLGLQPHPLFDTMHYAPEAIEVCEGGMNPLVHYLAIGWRNGLSPHPLFNNDWYLDRNPDVARAELPPLLHYVLSGARESRDPHPLFSVVHYNETNPDVHALGLDPLRHYISTGWREGRTPSDAFDARAYLAANPDVAASDIDPLRHYLTRGAWEQRKVAEDFDPKLMAALAPAEILAGQTPLEAWARRGRPKLGLGSGAVLGGQTASPQSSLVGQPESRARNTVRDAAVEASLFEQLADSARRKDTDNYSWASYLAISGAIRSAERKRIEQLSLPAPKLLDLAPGNVATAAAKLSFQKHSKPDVSIVIPVYNQLKYTVECLASILAARSDLKFEVIVGDDASTDQTAAVLGRVSGLELVTSASNQGFLRNVNAAAAKARGQVLVILNNDVQVTDGWLEPLVRALNDPTVGLAAPKMLFPNGRLQEAGARLEPDGTSRMIGLFDDPSLPRYNYARDIDYASGACIAVRQADFAKLNGFDLQFAPAYCEDVDLCMRIRDLGLRIRYEPASQIHHHLSVTSNALPGTYKLRQVRKNQQKLMERWGEGIDADNQVRVIALYLPQFHTVPENDRWWGAGFTEWKNVQRALPNFSSHYQPHRPGELGYYDLSNPETMEAQAALARSYGVHGFCFYYYSFSGRRMLEKPVDQIMERGSPDIPFCLCWANENWTRTWDGGDKSVLLAQTYRPEDDVAIIDDLIRYLKAPNYIRVNGKPLLAVYRPQLLPDARRTADTWRRICRERGVGEIYLAMVEVFEHARNQPDPKSWGYDSSIEFPPTGMGEPMQPPGDMLNPRFKGMVCDYRRMVQRYMQEPVPGFTRFRGVMPSWDNTARRQNDSYAFHHATPGAMQAWLEAVIDQTRDQNQGDERIVFVNAWNEWAEGAHLEPDERFGRGWLEAVRNAQTSDLLLPNRKPQGW